MLDFEQPEFEGDEDETRAYLNTLGHKAFYTYALLGPDLSPFYIGKGKGRRVFEHRLEAMRGTNLPTTNPFKCASIRKMIRDGFSLRYRIDRVFPLESQLDCLLREEALIARYRRRSEGGCLTNLAPGLGSLASSDPFSKTRHTATLAGVSAERPERTVVNLFLKSLGGVDSVPIKPLSEFGTRLAPAYPSPKPLKTPSRRNGLTLAAAAIAQGLTLRAGTVIRRAFELVPDMDSWPLPDPPPPSVLAVIENGAASDLLKLGLCTLVPAPQPVDEGFVLDATQAKTGIDLIGRRQAAMWDLV